MSTAKKYLDLNDPLFDTVYPMALDAAAWVLSRWPHLQLEFAPEDMANIWMIEKFKFLGSFDVTKSSLKFQVFLGVKRRFLHRVFVDDNTLSLDAFACNDDSARFVDNLEGDMAPTTEADLDLASLDEYLNPLSKISFGSQSAEREVQVEGVGNLPKTLKSIALLLILGYNKTQIGEFFGVGKMYISRLTRGPLAEALQLTR